MFSWFKKKQKDAPQEHTKHSVIESVPVESKERIDALVEEARLKAEQLLEDAKSPTEHITIEQLQRVFVRNKRIAEWHEAFNLVLDVYKMDKARLAMFLAQLGHESSDLTRLEEGLSYSAERLRQVWPSRFPTIESAQPFARNPEALANNVYGGRMGNTKPGDGFRFRGRGPIQLTGRSNYTMCAKDTGFNEILDNPDVLIHNKKLALMSSAWFFNKYTKGTDIRQVTRQINGGFHGLDDRTVRYDTASTVLGVV